MNSIEMKLQGKRVLVTGANGFIGSKLVEKLLECNSEVVALLDEEAYLDRIYDLLTSKKIGIIRCSMNDLKTLTEKIQKYGKIDLVAHLGLNIPSSHDFNEQSIEEINNNLKPAINLVTALGESVQGICFSSSASIYGTPSHLPVKEDDIPMPVSSYGFSKLAIENFLQTWGRAHKVPVTVLRYSTVFGPGELEHRLIPNFLKNISKGETPFIYGNGSEIRDYIYIDDVVQATVNALAIRPDGIYNIGSGHGHTTSEIAQKILKLYPTAIRPQFSPKSGVHVNLVCDNSAAKKALSFTPQTNLDDGLAKEIQWYKEHVEKKQPNSTLASANNLQPRAKVGKRAKTSFIKTIIDRALAFMGLVCSSPLMAVIAIGIRLESHGSPIFKQKRVGMNGNEFTIYKFRSMYTDNDDINYKTYLCKYVLENAPYRIDRNGQLIYKVDDGNTPVTKFGALLRKTNLDELPQLINILKGDMSFVGPRPDIPFAVEMYNDWHRERLFIKPGLTGSWQVGQRKNLSFEEMVRLDINYINERSLLLDTKIFLKTLGIVLGKNGS